jgi:hypothetical protein
MRSSDTTTRCSSSPCTSGRSIRHGRPGRPGGDDTEHPDVRRLGDAEYLRAFEHTVEPAVRRFCPGSAARVGRLRRPRRRSARPDARHRGRLSRARAALRVARPAGRRRARGRVRARHAAGPRWRPHWTGSRASEGLR